MQDEHINPYAAPRTDPTGGDYEGASIYGRVDLQTRSVIVAILLTIVTAGLYVNYWVHRNAIALNQQLPKYQLSMSVVVLFWIISITSLLWAFPEVLTDDHPTVVAFGSLLSVSDTVFTIAMAFSIRGRLNVLFDAKPHQARWVHGIWTFIFGIYYLQWKINRKLHDQQRSKDAVQEDSD